MPFLSRFRSKKGKVGGNEGDKIENHRIFGSSNSQPTTPPLPTVVKASQRQNVGEARDELTRSLRGKWGPFSQVHNPGEPLLKAQQALERSFNNLHATWVMSAVYYEGASVGDDAVVQAVAVASNDPLISADSYSKVIAKALLKDGEQQSTISNRTRVYMSKVYPVLSVVLGVVSFSADVVGFLPMKITANALSQVITLASDDHSSSIAVIEGLEELSDHQQFLNSLSSLNFELDNGTDSILIKATNLLVAITDFLRISIQFLQKHFIRRVWDQVTEDQVNIAMKSLKDARQNFDLAVQGAASATILRRENEEVTRKALDDMSPLTFNKIHDEIVRSRLNHSGRWLLEHPTFNKWLYGDVLTLWCPGEGGAGKTVLTSTVVDRVDSYLKSQRETQPGKRTGLVYLYCRFQNEAEQTVAQFIPSIIRQLAAQDLSTVSQVKKFNDEHSTQQATIGEYTSFLSELLDSFSAVYLMVDALDEFSKFEDEKKRLVKELLSLSRTRTSLRIFITSRPDRDIAKEIGGEKVEITASEMDIHAYIERAIETDSALRSWVGKRPGLRAKMLRTIPDKSLKIFQLAKMQIDHLVTEETVEDVIDALDSLSDNVNDYYQKSIERIERMNSVKVQNIIKNILKWVYYAKRPLTVREIYHILAVKPGNKSATRLMSNVEANMELGLEFFIDKSAGLITIREESQVVSVAHPTVQEYLKTLETTLLSTAEEEMSERCLTYLTLDAFGNGPLSTYWISELYFVEYAAKFWGEHLRGKAEENATLQSLALDFLKKERVLSYPVQDASALTQSMMSYRTFVLNVPGLIIASMFGLALIVKKLLGGGININQTSGDGETALYRASQTGREPVVQLLLDKGADVNAQGGEHHNALQAARVGGYDEIVKLLLSRGADPNARGRSSSSGVGAKSNVVDALEDGSGNAVTAVSYWLRAGAHANSQGPTYRSELREASAKGHFWIVDSLLQNRPPNVSVNAKGGRKYDALYAASIRGYEKTARLLVENGADANANNILEAASLEGHISVVKLLLQNGADVNAQGGPHNTALQAAAIKGRKLICELLLEKGANVNAQGCVAAYAGNALQAACSSGFKAVVRLVLENGADVNAPRDDLDNLHVYALQTAAASGHMEVAELLLDKGADVNANGGYTYNALWAAAEMGHKNMVRLLLDRGAIINIADGEHWETLWAARYGENNAVVEMIEESIRLCRLHGRYLAGATGVRRTMSVTPYERHAARAIGVRRTMSL
ncbi:hypothetical protein V492_00802 [Pseudogymnoascus sp. VKM F-4246]|nr:hypothetical protein V492_00802 [Pseudogymnoascus sp. VKM F-4246]